MALRPYKRSVYLMGGDRQDRSPFALPDSVSPEGSKNMRLKKPGIMEMVEGYATKNAIAYTTDTGADATRCIGLWHYKDSSGNRREVAVFTDDVDEVEIAHSTDDGATWTFLKDMGATAVGLIPYADQFKDDLYICFGGTELVQKYDGSTADDAGENQPATPTAAAGAAGNLDGTYKYKYAQIDANGDVGPYSRADTVVLEDEQGSLSGLVQGAGGVRIARTLGDGDTSEIFYVLKRTHTATTYTDNLSDTDLENAGTEIVSPGDAPPVGSEFCLPHRARMLYFETDDFHYSAVGNAESVGASSNTPLAEGEVGDKGMAAVTYEGEAMIFTQQRVYMLAGDGRQTYNLERSSASVGTISKNGVELLQGGVTYIDVSGATVKIEQPVVAYMTTEDVRIVGGGIEEVVSYAERDTFATLSYQYRDQAWCKFYAPYNQLVCGIPTGDQTYVYRCWDITTGTWNTIDFWPDLACAVVAETASASHVMLAGRAETAGTVYHLFNGTDADGSNITATVRTKALDNGEPGIRAYFDSFLPIFEAQASTFNVTWNLYEGFAGTGASAFATGTIDIAGSNVNYVSPDSSIQVKTAGGVRSHAKAHVLEFTVTGSALWAFCGWDWWYVPWPQPHLVTP